MSYTEDDLDRDVKRYVEIQAKIDDLNIELGDIKARFREHLALGSTAAPCGVSVTVSPQRRFSADKAREILTPELLALCTETTITSAKAKASLPPAVYEAAMVESGAARVVVS